MTNIKRRSVLGMVPIGDHTQITTTGSAQTVTNPSDTRASILVMQNTATTDTATATNIHYTLDGTDPTTSLGFLLEDGDGEVRWDFGGGTLPTIKVYLATGATLDYQWFMRG